MDLSFFGYWKEIDRKVYIMVLSRKTCFALNLRNLIKICKRPRICSEKRKSSMKSILRGAFKSPTSLNENILCIMNSPFHQQLKKMAFARHGRSTWRTKKHFYSLFLCASNNLSISNLFWRTPSNQESRVPSSAMYGSHPECMRWADKPILRNHRNPRLHSAFVLEQNIIAIRPICAKSSAGWTSNLVSYLHCTF